MMASSEILVYNEERRFGWDNNHGGIIILRVDEKEDEKVKSRREKSRNIYKSKIYCPHSYLILNFLDILNPKERIKFRKYFLRKVVPANPDVVLLQDIKNLVMFMVTTPVSLQFINFFHLRVVDRFLRALIIYFELYTKIWEEEIIEKRSATMKKAANPRAGGSRIERADEMEIIRSLLAREYCELLMGCEESAKYHHMMAGTSSSSVQSQGEKDLRIFEVLFAIAHRVVWIALQRKYFHLIEVEMHRLFRTDSYNTANRKTGGMINQGILDDEIKILHGMKIFPKRKLLKNSPLSDQLISGICDFRVVSLGLINFESRDPRINYLKNALLAEEEKLIQLNISVGILGHLRSDYDIMLIPIDSKIDVEHNEEQDKWNETRSSSTSSKMKKPTYLEKKSKGMPKYISDPELLEIFPMEKIVFKMDKYDEIREEARKKWISRELYRQSPLDLNSISIVTINGN